MVCQPIKGRPRAKKSSPKHHRKDKNSKPKFGISKLEQYFAKEFLDRYGIKYVYQYEAKDIGRFFDFAIVENQKYDYLLEDKQGVKSIVQEGQSFRVVLLIEVDGGYFHADPRVIGENAKLNKMQQKNRVVDGIKNSWAWLNGICLVRFWELDIRNNPKMVRKELSKHIKLRR